MAEGVRRAAVLGRPIAHSLSPTLHRAAYVALGLDWSYDAVDVGADELGPWLEARDESWAGLSLTMPLKTAVVPLLDEVEPLAATVGAVNTVLLRAGHRSGLNTDVPGLAAALAAVTDAAPGGASAAVLGAGATARSAIAALDSLGLAAVTCYARREDQGQALRELGERLGILVVVEPWRRGAEGLLADVVVSTVPSGASDEWSGAVPAGAGVLLDVVYDPWPTPLATAWTEHDGTVVSGLEFLVQQAALQVSAMTGRPAPLAAMRAAVLDLRPSP